MTAMNPTTPIIEYETIGRGAAFTGATTCIVTSELVETLPATAVKVTL